MEDIIKIILNWAIPVVLAGILWFMKKIINDMKAIKLSQLSLIRNQIARECENYTKLGYLPEYARYCLEDLFKQYKALGGNHGIEKLVDKTFELPSANEKEG